LGRDDPEEGVVVNGGIAEEVLIPEVFIKLLHGPIGIGLAFDLDGLEVLIV